MEERGHDPVKNLLHTLRGGQLDWSGRLAEEVICRQCGYNLFGLPAAGRCPECGAPVALSVGGDDLLSFPPDWILRISHAVQASGWTLLLMLGTAAALLWTRVDYVTMLLGALTLFWCVQAWMTSVRAPSEQTLSVSRWVLRVGTALVMAGLVGATLAVGTRALDPGSAVLLLLMTVIAFNAAIVAQMHVLGEFVRRMGFEVSADAVVRRGWLLAVMQLVSITCGASGCCLYVGAFLGVLVYGVLVPVTQLQVAAMLRTASEIARENRDVAERQLNRPDTGFQGPRGL